MKRTLNYLSLALSLTALLVFVSCGSDSDGIVIDTDLEIEFDATSASVAENGSAITATISFPAAPTALSLTANVTGTAVYDTDYTSSPAVSSGAISLSVAEGATSTSITFTPIDNNSTDGSRTVILTLQEAEGIELGTNTIYKITITDDDAAGISSVDEDFEGSSQDDGEVFVAADWLNYAEAGTQMWEHEIFSGDHYVEFTAFSTSEASNIGWLILPKINFDDLAVSEMSFWNAIGFGDNNTLLDLMYSTDFDGASGSIASATWTELSFNISTNDNEWVESGAIDLSGISGNGYIGFRYTGGTATDFDASYRIDNILVGAAAPSLTITESITDFGSVDSGLASAEQTFTVSGTSISGDVTVSVSNGFEVSLSSWDVVRNSSVVPSTTVTLSDVSSEQTVYVRFSPSSGINGVINGKITVSAAGALDKEIDLLGSESGNAATLGLLEETFDYGSVDGALTAVSSGAWSNHSGTAETLAYTATGLSMSGYAASGVGGAVSSIGTSEDANRTFAIQSSGTFYAAALVSIASANTSGTYFMHFKDDSFGFVSRVFGQDDGSGNLQLGLSNSSSGSVYSSTNYSYNTTYLVVIKFNADTGQSDLFVLSSVPSAEPTPDVSTGADGAKNNIQSIGIRQSSTTPKATIDGVIVTTDWTDFVSGP